MIYAETIEKLMAVLYRRYERKGSDFIFKSKAIAKDFDTSPQMVGHILVEAVRRGYPVDYYIKAKTGIHVWQTTIGENK